MTEHSRSTTWYRWIAVGLLAMTVSACADNVFAGLDDSAESDYQARLAHYQEVHGAYEARARAYWDAVAEKRRLRNEKRHRYQPIVLTDYVLSQPPVYDGPPEPRSPLMPSTPPSKRRQVPVVTDFLQAAREQFGFVPDRPQSELAFKRAYVRAAIAAGLSKDQVVGVYAFETGGNGDYDTQAGLGSARPDAHAISPALGYNQLLSTITLSLLAEHGSHLVAVLRYKARRLSGEPHLRMVRKIAALRRMIAFARRVPRHWSDYDRVANSTPQGLGIHAALLDVDLGPLLQAEKLVTSVKFARRAGYSGRLSAAELELMNLTGDGNGIDMVLMPEAMRERVPTANFFRATGYARNPVARRAGVVSGLIAEIQSHIDRAEQEQGARELTAAF